MTDDDLDLGPLPLTRRRERVVGWFVDHVTWPYWLWSILFTVYDDMVGCHCWRNTGRRRRWD